MKIFGISGLPGSGKSLVSELAVEKGAIIVSMGDIMREETKKRGEAAYLRPLRLKLLGDDNLE